MNDNMKRFVRSLMIGAVSEGVLPTGKEPVAYLYNGVRLPKLPEWDRESYPYAIIQKQASRYIFAVSTVPYTASTNGKLIAYGDSVRCQAFLQDDFSSYSWDLGEPVTLTDATYPSSFSKIWSNYDILNEDGSVYLAASEPIPVYE